MGWKKLILGEKMPDKDDPAYRKRYESEVATGRRFAEKLHLDRPFGLAQRFANRYPKAFLVIVFGFVISCFCMNLYRMNVAYHYHQSTRHVTATQIQEMRLQQMKDSIINTTVKPK